MTTKIYPGTKVRLKVQFLDAVEVPGDPDVVTFKLRQEAGAIIAYQYGVDSELVRDGVGQFHFDATFATGGLMRYRWEGAGELVAATEGFVQVECSAFA